MSTATQTANFFPQVIFCSYFLSFLLFSFFRSFVSRSRVNIPSQKVRNTSTLDICKREFLLNKHTEITSFGRRRNVCTSRWRRKDTVVILFRFFRRIARRMKNKKQNKNKKSSPANVSSRHVYGQGKPRSCHSSTRSDQALIARW